MADWWEKYKDNSESAQPSQAAPIATVQPQAQLSIPVNTPNVPPRGTGFQTTTNTGLEELDEFRERKRQLATEDARRMLESSKLTEMQNADRASYVESGKAAQQVKRVLGNLTKLEELPATKDIHTGPFSEVWLKAGQAARDLFPGKDKPDIFPKDQAISSAEALQKLGIILSTQSTKELTSRPAVFEFMKNLEANPGLMIRPETRKILAGILEKDADRHIELGKHALRAKDYYEFANKLDEVNADPKHQYEFPKEFQQGGKEPTKKEIAPGIRKIEQ